MSVREKPAANRYLQMREQEDAYNKHMKALADARPTINTTQPPLSGRLRELQKKNEQNRRMMIAGMERKEKLLDRTKNKSKTPRKFELKPQTARPRQDIYDDIDLFKQDTDKYKAPTSRIPLIRQQEFTTSSDEIQDPSSFDSDITDSDNIDMQSSENYRPEYESENIRFGYGKNFVETDSTTESTSLVSTSTESKKKSSKSSSAYNNAKTDSSAHQPKRRVPLVKAQNPADADTFLTSTDADEKYQPTSGRETERKSNIASQPAQKKAENSLSLSAVMKSKLEPAESQSREAPPPQEEKKEEEKLSSTKSSKKDSDFKSDSSSSSSKSSKSSDKPKEVKETKEEEKDAEQKHEEDLFSSDFGGDDSESISSESNKDEKVEDKKDEVKEEKKSSEENFEDDDDALDLPDF